MQLSKGRYSSDKKLSQRSAMGYLCFIEVHIGRLKNLKDRQAVKSFLLMKTPFTAAQLSYIDGLYEKIMKALGMPSISIKHDFSRRRI